MRHAAFVPWLFAVLACAGDPGATAALAQEGGGIGGSLAGPAPGPGHAAQTRKTPPHAAQPAAGSAAALYSYPINTQPDGWAALKAEPWSSSRRLTKVYDGTLFLVVGQVPGWKLVQFKSGERGWIVERLVGCCRPASH